MKQFEAITTIEDGAFKRNSNRIREALRALNGKKVELTLKVIRKERSLSQNGYYWAVIVPIWTKLIEKEWGEFFNSKETHEFLKYNCNYEEKYVEETGEIFRAAKSTKENSTVEQEEFHSKARQLALTNFNVDIPLPEEQVKIKL